MSFGDHIPLNDIIEYYKSHDLTTPIQIFTGNPRTFSRKNLVLSDSIKNLISKVSLFVHSSYIINIGRMDLKATAYLCQDIIISNDLGAQGIIIHVGKSLKSPEKDGISHMHTNISNALNFIKTNNIKTKLLLETPAGQGTELLTDIDEFIGFCKLFSNIHFGICIDTCHVFSLGYSPSEYIKKVLKSGLKIDLVHLNDSQREKGSRVDRHEHIFKGHIPKEDLMEAMKICEKNKIPMVCE
jgi:deoxyribonuclease-4